MCLQLYEEVPGICKNPQCDNFRCFELYDVDNVKIVQGGKDNIECCECKEKIYLD